MKVRRGKEGGEEGLDTKYYEWKEKGKERRRGR